MITQMMQGSHECPGGTVVCCAIGLKRSHGHRAGRWVCSLHCL